jgi:anti-sigma regulatory factor (Ser/Thr protein kinase)
VKIAEIKKTLEAKVLEGRNSLNIEVEQVYASDLMSDVLAFGKPNSILLTGLATQQAIISAHMAEFKGVVLIRGKTPRDGANKVARDNELVLLSTKLDMFEACVKINSIHQKGSTSAVEVVENSVPEQLLLVHEFVIEGDDFTNAGMVSTAVKSVLKKIGLETLLIRRVAISTYEAEMNVVMHASKANVSLSVTPTHIILIVADEGKGIPDVEKAMQKGFSTATDDMRAMGFGAGMGLPNIKKNSNQLKVESKIGVGTTLEMTFNI